MTVQSTVVPGIYFMFIVTMHYMIQYHGPITVMVLTNKITYYGVYIRMLCTVIMHAVVV